MGRRDYEGASMSGVTGNVAGSSTSDVGSSQSIGQQASGRSFSGADLYDYSSDDGGPSTAASIRNALRGTPLGGMNYDQYKKSFGLSDTNPYGQTGFTQFMNKFGAKPDYTQQLSNLPRTGTVFKGGTIKRDATGKLLGGVDAATYNAPGAVSERIMQKQYDAYLNPFNLPQVPGFDPDYDTATQAEVDAGKITRGGRTDRGSYLGPLEEVVRPQSTGEMVARALMPAGTGLIDTTDTYLSSAVTPEMRARGPQGLLEKAFQGGTGVDPTQLDRKASSLGDGIRSLISGRETPAPVVDMTNRAESMVPAAEEGILPQGIRPEVAEQPLGGEDIRNMMSNIALGMDTTYAGTGLPSDLYQADTAVAQSNIIQTDAGPVNLDDLSFAEKLSLIGSGVSNLPSKVGETTMSATGGALESINEALFGSPEQQMQAYQEERDLSRREYQMRQNLEEQILERLEREGGLKFSPATAEDLQYMETLTRGQRGGETTSVPVSAAQEDYKQYGAGTQKGVRILDSLGKEFRK